MLKLKEFIVCSILQLLYVAIIIQTYNPIPDTKETKLMMEGDKKRNLTEIIESRGFEAKEYEVTTEDGYIMRIQRIINPLISPEHKVKMKPIIMQHGLGTSGIDFIIQSPNVKPARWPPIDDDVDANPNEGGVFYDGRWIDTQKQPNALAFYLANRGYDVFLANSRNTIYGQKHVELDPKKSKFWNFSLDELAQYDLPATIEYVLRLTGKKQLGFVGHSQGTAIMFALLAHKPHYGDIVKPFVALAPVVYLANLKTRIRFAKYILPYLNRINSPFLAQATLIKKLFPAICMPGLIRSIFCKNIVYFFTGLNDDRFTVDRSTAYFAHVPAGTSIKILAHFGQWIKYNRFAHFSHGKEGNLKEYHTIEPPLYDISKITSNSIALFVAKNDAMVSEIDLKRMLSELTVKPHSIHNMTQFEPGWNHMDFMHSLRTGELINPKIEQVLRDFDNYSDGPIQLPKTKETYEDYDSDSNEIQDAL